MVLPKRVDLVLLPVEAPKAEWITRILDCPTIDSRGLIAITTRILVVHMPHFESECLARSGSCCRAT
jgi:hypothetical protein